VRHRQALWTLSLLSNTLYAFDWMSVSFMFFFAAWAYMVLTVSAAHVVVFGGVAWHKSGGVERAQQQGQAAVEMARNRSGGVPSMSPLSRFGMGYRSV
jgi:hypothetical protein